MLPGPAGPGPCASARRQAQVPPRTSASRPRELARYRCAAFRSPKAPSQRPRSNLGYSRGSPGTRPRGQAPGSAAFAEASKRNSIFGAGGHPRPANGTPRLSTRDGSLAVLVGLFFSQTRFAYTRPPPRNRLHSCHHRQLNDPECGRTGYVLPCGFRVRGSYGPPWSPPCNGSLRVLRPARPRAVDRGRYAQLRCSCTGVI
jgi:hypothetical protein